MISVLAKSSLLLLINAALGITYTACLNIDRAYAPWETKSALYKIPQSEHVGWLFLGSSHAEVFGHCPENVAFIQSILDDDAAFLTKRGSGVFQHRLFLEEFYRDGNQARNIVYVVDPWAFYSPHWNETMRFIDYEPLDASLMWNLARSDVESSTLLAYVRSKFTRDWYHQGPLPPDAGSCLRKLDSRDANMVQKSVHRFFPDGTPSEHLESYLEELRRIVELAESHGSELILISTPTLLGELPGADAVRVALAEQFEANGIPYHDFSNAIDNPALFHDHDHLNDDGVRHLFEIHLTPRLLNP